MATKSSRIKLELRWIIVASEGVNRGYRDNTAATLEAESLLRTLVIQIVSIDA